MWIVAGFLVGVIVGAIGSLVVANIAISQAIGRSEWESDGR